MGSQYIAEYYIPLGCPLNEVNISPRSLEWSETSDMFYTNGPWYVWQYECVINVCSCPKHKWVGVYEKAVWHGHSKMAGEATIKWPDNSERCKCSLSWDPEWKEMGNVAKKWCGAMIFLRRLPFICKIISLNHSSLLKLMTCVILSVQLFGKCCYPCSLLELHFLLVNHFLIKIRDHQKEI